MNVKRPDSTWSDRRLSNVECAWCGQRLDRAKRGECSAIYQGEGFECQWPGILNAPNQDVTANPSRTDQ